MGAAAGRPAQKYEDFKLYQLVPDAMGSGSWLAVQRLCHEHLRRKHQVLDRIWKALTALLDECCYTVRVACDPLEALTMPDGFRAQVSMLDISLPAVRHLTRQCRRV